MVILCVGLYILMKLIITTACNVNALKWFPTLSIIYNYLHRDKNDFTGNRYLPGKLSVMYTFNKQIMGFVSNHETDFRYYVLDRASKVLTYS